MAAATADTVVEFYQGEAETWDKWPTIRRANPLDRGIAGVPAAVAQGAGRGAWR